jgi:hypothetical protein
MAASNPGVRKVKGDSKGKKRWLFSQGAKMEVRTAEAATFSRISSRNLAFFSGGYSKGRSIP